MDTCNSIHIDEPFSQRLEKGPTVRDSVGSNDDQAEWCVANQDVAREMVEGGSTHNA